MVLLIIIIVCIVVGILIKKYIKNEQEYEQWKKQREWENSEEGKKEIARRKQIKDSKWCSGKPSSIERTVVTGDYFSADFSRGDYSGYGSGTTYYCKYKNSTNCLYCSRRKELFMNDKFYYGSSKNCYYYSLD